MEHFFENILEFAILKGASDIHLPAGSRASIRVEGEMIRLVDIELPIQKKVKYMIQSLLSYDQQEILESKRQIDFLYVYKDKRFRANAFYQRKGLSLSMRLINSTIPRLEDLGVPSHVKNILDNHHQGLILLCGPTGQGKTTTLAALVQHINETKNVHIITVEDPVEYLFEDDKATIEQREVPYDVDSFSNALMSSMRQDPDVLVAGEVRGIETIQSLMTMAETGHLVLSTIHTNSAPQTIDRLIDVFPENQQNQIRMQLANALTAIVSQRLITLPGQKRRVLACEILIANDAVRNMIRENNIHMISNVMQTGLKDGMMTLDKHLSQLVKRHQIPYEIAMKHAQDKTNLQFLIG